MLKRRPILVTAIYWLIAQLIIVANYLKCGFGAGWDEESHQQIADCRVGAIIENEVIVVIAIIVYAVWAVVTIKGLQREETK